MLLNVTVYPPLPSLVMEYASVVPYTYTTVNVYVLNSAVRVISSETTVPSEMPQPANVSYESLGTAVYVMDVPSWSMNVIFVESLSSMSTVDPVFIGTLSPSE